jgi:arylsulfatase A-like enzyme
LAASGVRFDHAIVQRPKTSPNVATILTGAYPVSHGVHQVMHALPAFNLTLAEILSDAGWHTGAVITNGNLYPEFQFDQGFETYEYGHKNAREGADKARAWLDERGTDQPWLLWVHATDPHWPYDPPEPWRSRLAQAGADAHQDAVDRYDGEIAFADHETGRILAWLHEHPQIAERTLVVFTADHGESLGEHDYSYEHGLHPYEPSVHVPLLISFPKRVPTGQVREPVVGSVDIVPTILDALQVPVPPTVQGESLLPLVLGLRNESPRGFAFLEAGYGEHIGPGRTRALRTRTRKYVRRLKEWAIAPRLGSLIWTFDAALEGGLAADECYDLVADPEELHSLGFDPALRDSVDAFHRELARQARDNGGREPGELDEKTEASLRSLGYIE